MSSLDDVFVALAHPVRRSLLETLTMGDRPVGELARQYRVSRPAISQHLRVLLDAGLVEGQRDGRTNRYSLRPQSLADAHAWLGRYEEFWDQSMKRLGAYLDRTTQSQRRKS